MKSETKMVRFGQVVIGAPGAGKSTYCRAAGNYLNAINRECVLINLGKVKMVTFDYLINLILINYF